MGKDYTLSCDGETMSAYITGKKVFTHPADARIETDKQGNILNVYKLS